MVRFVWYDTAQLPKIRKAAERNEWFTAIVLSATQLERHSYWIIREYLEYRRIESRLVDLLIEPLHLFQFAECLLAMKAIDERECQTIKEINKARNFFIHRRMREKFKRGREAREAYSSLVDAAIKILEEKLQAKTAMVGS